MLGVSIIFPLALLVLTLLKMVEPDSWVTFTMVHPYDCRRQETNLVQQRRELPLARSAGTKT
jgi:hypothetical protein